jgi:hypothetical protein
MKLQVFFITEVIGVTKDFFDQDNSNSMGPEDGPNQPMGQALGINPGRVVWAWNPVPPMRIVRMS